MSGLPKHKQRVTGTPLPHCCADHPSVRSCPAGGLSPGKCKTDVRVRHRLTINRMNAFAFSISSIPDKVDTLKFDNGRIMSELITCIFCMEDHPSTDEHVVPEFAGGSLIIKDVCKTCNSKMGSDFEGPISRSIIFRLPRHIHGIQGKSDEPINAFPSMGKTEDGSKVRVDSQFKPYLATQVSEEKLENGGVKIDLRVDASDKDKIPGIVEAKIRRIAKNEWPDMPAPEVDALVKSALDSLPQDHQVHSHNPTIGYSEYVDINHLTFLMMKIAYEIAFHHHGYGILSDSRNVLLRESIHLRDSKSKISGTLFPNPDPLSYISVPENNHCILLCGNTCYIRLFNIIAIIEVCGIESPFFLKEELWSVYWFDFVAITWKKETFLEHLSRSIA